MSATLTSFPAVTVVSALVPVFLPTLTLVTPLTPLSAACTFLEHPDAHRNPVTAKTVVFSSAATTSAWVVVVVTTGAATAPAVKAAKAAIIVIVVFMFPLMTLLILLMMMIDDCGERHDRGGHSKHKTAKFGNQK